MIEGISKETLIRLMQDPNCDSSDYATYDYLMSLCAELDPWLPIDENTPKDREMILLYNNHKFIGEWCRQHGRWEDNCGCDIYPTHYKLLPEDTK